MSIRSLFMSENQEVSASSQGAWLRALYMATPWDAGCHPL